MANMKTYSVAFFLLALASCGPVPAPADYANRGDPESLLSTSSEVVTVSLDSQESLGELTDTLSKTPPTRAILHCPTADALCAQAKDILSKHKVAAQETGSGSSVTLLYEQTVAHACENRYIDNSVNEYNLEPVSMGCSLRGNTVQMVTDKKQFTSPQLLSPMDGEKAAQTYDDYLNPPVPEQKSQGLSGPLVTSSSPQQ